MSNDYSKCCICGDLYMPELSDSHDCSVNMARTIQSLQRELAELKRQNEITESINTQMGIQIKSLKQERSLFTSIVFKKGNKSVPNFDTEEECLAWLDHFTPQQEAE